MTHQRPPGQPRGISESSTEPEIDAALPKIVISELTTRSAGNMEPPSRTWQWGMYIPTHGPNNFSFRAAVPAPEGEDLLRTTSSELAPTSPPGGVLRHTSIPLRWAWA